MNDFNTFARGKIIALSNYFSKETQKLMNEDEKKTKKTPSSKMWYFAEIATIAAAFLIIITIILLAIAFKESQPAKITSYVLVGVLALLMILLGAEMTLGNKARMIEKRHFSQQMKVKDHYKAIYSLIPLEYKEGCEQDLTWADKAKELFIEGAKKVASKDTYTLIDKSSKLNWLLHEDLYETKEKEFSNVILLETKVENSEAKDYAFGFKTSLVKITKKMKCFNEEKHLYSLEENISEEKIKAIVEIINSFKLDKRNYGAYYDSKSKSLKIWVATKVSLFAKQDGDISVPSIIQDLYFIKKLIEVSSSLLNLNSANKIEDNSPKINDKKEPSKEAK